jgi:hypothetical protein
MKEWLMNLFSGFFQQKKEVEEAAQHAREVNKQAQAQTLNTARKVGSIRLIIESADEVDEMFNRKKAR